MPTATDDNNNNNNNSTTSDDLPVTVVVTRRVRVGCESAYERWLDKLIEDASKMPGYAGARVHKAKNRSGGTTYTSIFRFDTLAHLRAFEESDVRRKALSEVPPLVEGDAIWNQLTGLELWFTPPAGTIVPQPSRLRMAVVMIAVVYLLVFSIGSAVAALLSSLPIPLRLLITITIEVFLMTYVIMPRLTRALSRWIYPKTAVK